MATAAPPETEAEILARLLAPVPWSYDRPVATPRLNMREARKEKRLYEKGGGAANVSGQRQRESLSYSMATEYGSIPPELHPLVVEVGDILEAYVNGLDVLPPCTLPGEEDCPYVGRVAVHEAGHIVQCVLDEVTIFHATIAPDPATGSLGHVKIPPHVEPGPNDLAGIAAEIVMLGNARYQGVGSDFDRVAEAEWNGTVRRCWRSAVQDIYEHRDAVRIIAEALLTRTTLDARALYAEILPPLFPDLARRFFLIAPPEAGLRSEASE